MDISAILVKAADALWQVLLLGLVLGAGLPTLFALGVRALNTGRVVVTEGPDGEVTRASTGGTAVAAVCFAVCILAVAFGIVVLVWGKQPFGA